jgi:septal ring factor EnvC (AmiA/AmiB activator)
VLSFITGHLQDPKNNIRLGAIRALAKLGDPRAIVKLNGWLSADPDSAEHKAARSTIDTLNRQNQPGDDLRNLRNKIQEMESSHKSLENQLADLKNKLEALTIPAEPSKEGNKEESKEN